MSFSPSARAAGLFLLRLCAAPFLLLALLVVFLITWVTHGADAAVATVEAALSAVQVAEGPREHGSFPAIDSAEEVL